MTVSREEVICLLPNRGNPYQLCTPSHCILRTRDHGSFIAMIIGYNSPIAIPVTSWMPHALHTYIGYRLVIWHSIGDSGMEVLFSQLQSGSGYRMQH